MPAGDAREATGVSDAVARLLSRLEGVRRIGGSQWMACCPAHGDDKPSLHVSLGQEGRALVRCMAGCHYEQVLAAIGLRTIDLFSRDGTDLDRGQPASTDQPRLYDTAREALRVFIRRLGKPAGVWCYYDHFQRPVGVVARFHDADGKTYRQISRHASGKWWCKGMPEPRPLYRLQDLLADNGDLALVVEGEKCADRLRSALAESNIPIPVVTSAGGTQAIEQTDWSPLRGRRVTILPDNDTTGRLMAARLKTRLHRLGVRQVHILHLPDLPPKGDVFDWLESPAADPRWLAAQASA